MGWVAAGAAGVGFTLLGGAVFAWAQPRDPDGARENSIAASTPAEARVGSVTAQNDAVPAAHDAARSKPRAEAIGGAIGIPADLPAGYGVEIAYKGAGVEVCGDAIQRLATAANVKARGLPALGSSPAWGDA